MRQIRIYQLGDYRTGDTLPLSQEASHHVARVLRMQLGESLTLFCGDNREFVAIISSVGKKEVQVCIQSEKEVSKESPLHIHLAQAVSKGDRMDMVMQKAVELGVTSITPVITELCAVKLTPEKMTKKLHQWQAVLVGACEQCGRNTLPTLNSFIALDNYFPTVNSSVKWILDTTTASTWRNKQPKPLDITLLVGPEGGFSKEEVVQAQALGFESISFGPRILRTETAAISALSVLQAVYGDL